MCAKTTLSVTSLLTSLIATTLTVSSAFAGGFNYSDEIAPESKDALILSMDVTDARLAATSSKDNKNNFQVDSVTVLNKTQGTGTGKLKEDQWPLPKRYFEFKFLTGNGAWTDSIDISSIGGKKIKFTETIKYYFNGVDKAPSYEETVSSEAEITQGTWEGYTAGQDIKFDFTDAKSGFYKSTLNKTLTFANIKVNDFTRELSDFNGTLKANPARSQVLSGFQGIGSCLIKGGTAMTCSTSGAQLRFVSDFYKKEEKSQ